jgi:hypothetical protein
MPPGTPRAGSLQRPDDLRRCSSVRREDSGVPKSSEKSAFTSETDGQRGPKTRGAPEVVAPSSRVNVAFPFSQIKVEEPSSELAELASLVFELIGTMAEWVPEDQLEELSARARAVRDRLR